MADNSEDSMVEEREELMVSPTGGNPFLRKAHFLKPTSPFSSINDNVPPFKLPPAHSFSSSIPSNLAVEFRGWPTKAHKDWKTWVVQMASMHQSTWKKAGIYQAILNSVYLIRKQEDLVYGLAEKWCCETNTFIFPWGEATITLEDVMVLGGYSVLGDSVFSPLRSEEMKEMKETLHEARKEIYETGVQEVTANFWKDNFMSSGRAFEHEAFLVYWLSRYVFPGARGTIHNSVFSIAIHLARGTRIALAPAILASIYKDLGLLKKTIVGSTQLKLGVELILKSPFQLVQVWAWERFSDLRPEKLNLVNYGEPRMARWDRLNGPKVANLKRVLDSAGDNFLWRPYALLVIENRHLPKYYPQKEMSVLVGPDLDDELLSFVRFLRVSELVMLSPSLSSKALPGMKELYLPHRVAMQFGYDQDLPCSVTRSNQDPHIAWQHYNKEIKKVKLYLPSRLFEADVSEKYLKWWKQSVPRLEDAIEAAVPRKKRSKRTKGMKWLLLTANHPSLPPGFTPRHERMQTEDGMDEEDKLLISEVLKGRKKHENFGIQGSDTEKLSGQVLNLEPPVAEESYANTMKLSDEDIVDIVDNGSSSSSYLFEKRLLDLKARCKRIESVVQKLITHTFGNQ